MIERNLLNRLATAVMPYMTEVATRRAYLEQALRGEEVLQHIRFDGDDYTFTYDMLRKLDTFETDGTYMVALLDAVGKNLGANYQANFAQLSRDVRAFYAPLPTPAEGEHRSGDTTGKLVKSVNRVPDLPDRGIGLVGRESYQERVKTALDDGRDVLIYGLGGTGKTALAAQVVFDWMRVHQGEPVLYVKAGSMETDTILAALGYPMDPGAVPRAQDKADALLTLIENAGIKLVWIDDVWNGETLRGVREAVPYDVSLVVTTRQRRMSGALPGCEAVYLPDMQPDKAVELMSKIARDVNTDAAPELCDKLANMAYAVRVAAMTMRNQGISAADMLEQVTADRKRMFELSAEFEADEGRRNLASLIEASLDELSDAARRVFMATGAFFAPTITAEMLDIYLNYELVHDDADSGVWRAVAQKPEQVDIQAAIAELVEHGLFVPVAANEDMIAHYGTHDLAHAYAELDTGDTDKERAVRTCIAYTYRYNSPSIANHNTLHAELPNFEGASAWGLTHEMWGETERFAWNLYALGGSEFTKYRGLYSDALRILERATKAVDWLGIQRNQSDHLNNIGLMYRHLGNYTQAISYCERAMKISQDIGDRQGEGIYLGSLGIAYWEMGEYEQAIDCYEQAVTIAAETGDRHNEGVHLGNLAGVYVSMNDHEQAIEHLERALEIAQEIGDRQGEGRHLGSLGITYSNTEEYEQAIDYTHQALVIAQEIGDRSNEGYWLNNLGVVYEYMGEYDTAIDCYERALVIRRKIGVVSLIEQTENNLSDANRKKAEQADDETSGDSDD